MRFFFGGYLCVTVDDGMMMIRGCVFLECCLNDCLQSLSIILDDRTWSCNYCVSTVSGNPGGFHEGLSW